MEEYVNKLNEVLSELKLKADIRSYYSEGPFLIFDLSLHSGGKFKQIEKHSMEIALALKAISEPLVYPVTRDGVVRMEVMVGEQETVMFSDVSGCLDDGILPLALGKTRDGRPFTIDLTKMPHLLIGGSTGSGKSIMLHSIINSILLQPDVRLALVDPKRVEFSYYDNVKKLYAPIARSVGETISLLERLVVEMETRFNKLESCGCRSIATYTKKMPYIVVVIDELADLMVADKKSIQGLLCKLAQKSRACGIHIVAATQRPSVDVVTGLIKANFPARIACRVISNTDSRVILDSGGAEKLLGNGDAIIESSEHEFKRFKGAFLSEQYIIDNAKAYSNWWSNIWNG